MSTHYSTISHLPLLEQARMMRVEALRVPGLGEKDRAEINNRDLRTFIPQRSLNNSVPSYQPPAQPSPYSHNNGQMMSLLLQMMQLQMMLFQGFSTFGGGFHRS